MMVKMFFLELLPDLFLLFEDALTWLFEMHYDMLFGLFSTLFVDLMHEKSQYIAMFWKYVIQHQSYNEVTPCMQRYPQRKSTSSGNIDAQGIKQEVTPRKVAEHSGCSSFFNLLQHLVMHC